MSLGSFISGFVPMLRLGSFNFSLNMAVFQEMRRSAEYKWPEQDRIGQAPALQFVGLGAETISLPGVIYPEWRGSAAAMAQLREMAAAGQPYLLIDAGGNIYGRWVITQVDETRSAFAGFTVPRKIEFDVTLKRFDGADSNALVNLITQALGQ
ncbi:tail protein [Burkholderia phage Mica]|uniref:Baseplate protein n=1 Tax=Burkholderia phage Mica TaxID=2767579 RepID=A0A873WF02_9CAUD|nr:tail protein [Burkholderia phage Mica]QPB08638.1 baseplate protein [Burkholderia phage Mica]